MNWIRAMDGSLVSVAHVARFEIAAAIEGRYQILAHMPGHANHPVADHLESVEAASEWIESRLRGFGAIS
jgi:hypothetical protein